jgi:hypothetical protein
MVTLLSMNFLMDLSTVYVDSMSSSLVCLRLPVSRLPCRKTPSPHKMSFVSWCWISLHLAGIDRLLYYHYRSPSASWEVGWGVINAINTIYVLLPLPPSPGPLPPFLPQSLPIPSIALNTHHRPASCGPHPSSLSSARNPTVDQSS